MCGRFALHSQPNELAKLFNFIRVPRHSSLRGGRGRYNIAPSQTILAVVGVANEAARSIDRCALAMRWGFSSRPSSTSSLLINARIETAASRPTFRDSFRHRRCLIPIDGFYEWHAEKGGKIPYYFHTKDEQPFLLAGLWESAIGARSTDDIAKIIDENTIDIEASQETEQAPTDPSEEPILRCTILTTESVEPVRAIHTRMPVALPLDAADQWLNPAIQDPAEAMEIIKSVATVPLRSRRVDPRVNRTTVDDPDCITPAEEEPKERQLRLWPPEEEEPTT